MTKTSLVTALAVASVTLAWTGGEALEPPLPAGTISGTVTLEPPPPPRRTANRYPGAPAPPRIEQQVPAVVYLEGAIPGAPAPSATRTMAQRDTAFVPAGMTVTVGATVSFPNEDPFFHNVFSYSGAKEFDLGRYPEGQTKEVVFDKAGPVELFCEVHDFMRGLIVVAENPFHAVVDEEGSFTLEGVPPGEYTLVAWHPDHDERHETVTVTDGGVTRVEVELRR